jgi:hypothetical protein
MGDAGAAMKSASPQLDYAPPPPLYRHRRFRRIVVLLVLLAAAYPAWRWGSWAWGRGKMLYAQHRCLNYSPPGDLVVFESDEVRAGELIKRAEYKLIWPASNNTVVGHMPDELRNFEDPVLRVSRAPCAILFMHELRDKGGHERLVIVARTAANTGPLFYSPFNLFKSIFKPATMHDDLWDVSRSSYPRRAYHGPVQFLPTEGLRFYAGQVDPADASHFTIRYELGGKAGLIDGRLNDAGDDVDFVISGPAGPPSPWSNILQK